MAETSSEQDHESAPSRVAIITGAGGAIGRGIAAELAATGFRVHVLDLEPAGLERTRQEVVQAGGTCLTYVCDVTDPARVQATVADATRDAGHVDVLVNSAGIVHVDDFLELSFETWRRVMAVNADGTFLMGQAAARLMVRQSVSALFRRRGMIINIASAAAEVGRPTRAAYAASKAVVRHLTMTQALALKPHDVAACVVYPGEVIEGMLRSIYMDTATAEGRDVQELIGAAESIQPTGRFQTPSEVGQRVAFLANSIGMIHTGALLWCDSHLDPIPPS